MCIHGVSNLTRESPNYDECERINIVNNLKLFIYQVI